MMKYSNVIFDFDGTLADTAAVILETMRRTIRTLGLPAKSDAQCRAMIGYRLEEMPAILWPEIPGLAGRFVTVYREIFNEIKDSYGVRLFPHVSPTISELNRLGVRMAIASSRSRASLEEYCAQAHIGDFFRMMVGGGDVKQGKPAPDPVNLVLGAQQWDKRETLVVGDMNVDILMGRGAGTATCGVTYGNGTVADLKGAGADYVISDFSELIGIVEAVTPKIAGYVEREIIPRYAAFDKAHREDHVRMVIDQSLQLAEHEPELNRDMVYVIAAFHDLGLTNGRENHHKDSRRILEEDVFLRSHFTAEQIRIMGEAVEDHRASNSHEPRSRYGLIVAEADRCIDIESIIRRAIQYGVSNYPELDRAGHYRRAIAHLIEKYGPEGYLKVRLPWSDNARRLKQLQTLMTDQPSLREIFNRLYDEETRPPQ